ncbi:TNT domain-containing protein [Nocardiopsis potens]|uniref:TNT domain-containing protein n=1 Tax=Nocardiopsis potens TaxID=1246458 RepID=UPI00034CC602|nr:TNT domain-containing protein [Nocardiopsis potens]
MPRDYDSQLLESVAVRRKRLREAAVFGPQRSRRRLEEHLTKIIAGVVIAAVGCAGTVGWSFLQSRLKTQEEEKAQAEAGPPAPGSLPVPADWVGADVGLDMLREELGQAGVDEELYVLPGEPRPEAGEVESYYLVSKEGDYFTVGIVEYEQGRTGVEFASEDETARWLYRELAIVDPGPRELTAEERAQAKERRAGLDAEAKERVSGGGDSAKLTLEPGLVVDAFGQESGSLLFPDGLPFEERGLPESAADPSGYHRYRVTYPFQVSASLSPESGGDPGGGLRFGIDPGGFTEPPELPSVRWLLRNGYLERIEPGEVPA